MWRMRLCLIASFLLLPACASVFAQDLVVPGAGAPPSRASGSRPVPPGRPPGGPPGQPGEAKPGEEGKDAAGGAKKEDEKKPDDAPAVIRRADVTPETESQQMLNMKPDASGKVRFNVEGAKWLTVLKWLADVSHLSLDWQELPGDYLNLRTQESYTIDEAQDVINRHLLARGFTLLKSGEVLSVVNISKINPGLVPRVSPDDLDLRRPYEFVKVSFPLEWMLADEAVTELTPMKSPNGTLTALKSTNRIEAMDAVINLREIQLLLQQEQRGEGEPTVIKVFPLVNVRAGEVLLLLEGILGLENNRMPSGNVSDSMGQQIMRQLQQMQQNMSNSNKSSGGDKGGPSEPRLIVDERRNSIIASAAPDKMEVISQTIKALDVPSERGDHILQHLDQMKVYRLSTLDPQPLVDILTDLGQLSPETKIEVDASSKSILVYGSLADHVTVQSLVGKLDGSTRNFDVIPLRRLRADAVAATIQYMLGEDEDKENQNSSRYSYYGYSSRGGGSQTTDDKRPFRVDADIENNRLLLWANEVELTEVQQLLVKMGEMPSGTGSSETLRVIDFMNDEDAEKVIERLRRLWPTVEPNELQIQDLAPAATTEEESGTSPQEPDSTPRPETAPAKSPVISRHERSAPLMLAYHEIDAPIEGDATPHRRQDTAETRDEVGTDVPPQSRRSQVNNNLAPEITIQRGPNGRLIIGSPDTRALDRLEDMLGDLAPPRRDYQVFRLKYPNTWAYGIELTLEEIFDEELKDEGPSYDPWYGFSRSSGDTKTDTGRLSQRKPLKIIADEDTRTILVQGATPSQLEIIEDIIEVYDQPQSGDPQNIRQTELFRIRYSQAKIVADTVKAVYRDLLSENDPALQSGKKDDKPAAAERSYTYVYGSGTQGDTEQPTQIKFKGLLSVGVDELSNTIVVSAVGGLMSEISVLIKALDEAAKPDLDVRVIQLDAGGVDIRKLRERLNDTFNGGRQKQQQQQNGQPNGQQGPDGQGPQNGQGNGYQGGAAPAQQ